jgi:hypothetical protein
VDILHDGVAEDTALKLERIVIADADGLTNIAPGRRSQFEIELDRLEWLVRRLKPYPVWRQWWIDNTGEPPSLRRENGYSLVRNGLMEACQELRRRAWQA